MSATTDPAAVAPSRRPTPARSWVALLLVLGPVWWIAVPFLVNRYLFGLPEVGLLVGPTLSFFTAFIGLVVAIYALDRAPEQGWSTTVAWVSIAIFGLFTLLFAVLFALVVFGGHGVSR